MKHRFKTPLFIIGVTAAKDADDLFNDRKAGVIGSCLCNVIASETAEKTDSNPATFSIKKTVGIPKDSPIGIGGEVSLDGRRYLVIDAYPLRYWKQIEITCEVKGHERS